MKTLLVTLYLILRPFTNLRNRRWYRKRLGSAWALFSDGGWRWFDNAKLISEYPLYWTQLWGQILEIEDYEHAEASSPHGDSEGGER